MHRLISLTEAASERWNITNELVTTCITGLSYMSYFLFQENLQQKWVSIYRIECFLSREHLEFDILINGHEFVNEIVHSLVRDWPGEITIVNGRPRNPKCQEQGNSIVEKLIGARFQEVQSDDYPAWLSFIQCKLTMIGNM